MINLNVFLDFFSALNLNSLFLKPLVFSSIVKSDKSAGFLGSLLFNLFKSSLLLVSASINVCTFSSIFSGSSVTEIIGFNPMYKILLSINPLYHVVISSLSILCLNANFIEPNSLALQKAIS